MRALSIGILLSAALLSGCAKKPTMNLHHAEVSGVQLGFPPSVSVVMTVVLAVYNPNSYDIAIRRVRGTSFIAGQYSLPVDYQPVGNDGLWLAADTTSYLRVPISVPLDVALRLLQTTMGSPSVAYSFSGRADVTATRSLRIEKDDYAVNESGMFQRQQLEIALAGMNLSFPR
jgi:hypothetical protein